MESLLSLVSRMHEFQSLPTLLHVPALPACSTFKMLRRLAQSNPPHQHGEGFTVDSLNNNRWNAGVTVPQRKS